MSKFRNPVMPCDAFAAGESEAVPHPGEAAEMNMASSVDARVEASPNPARAAGGSAPRTRQLQVRDNAQRTRFILVWSDIDGAVILATGRTFRTIRDAMTEGITQFGVLPIRER